MYLFKEFFKSVILLLGLFFLINFIKVCFFLRVGIVGILLMIIKVFRFLLSFWSCLIFFSILVKILVFNWLGVVGISIILFKSIVFWVFLLYFFLVLIRIFLYLDIICFKVLLKLLLWLNKLKVGCFFLVWIVVKVFIDFWLFVFKIIIFLLFLSNCMVKFK